MRNPTQVNWGCVPRRRSCSVLNTKIAGPTTRTQEIRIQAFDPTKLYDQSQIRPMKFMGAPYLSGSNAGHVNAHTGVRVPGLSRRDWAVMQRHVSTLWHSMSILSEKFSATPPAATRQTGIARQPQPAVTTHARPPTPMQVIAPMVQKSFQREASHAFASFCASRSSVDARGSCRMSHRHSSYRGP